MAQHVKILGALHIALAAFGILAAVIVFVVLGGISGLIHMGGIDAGSDAEMAAPVIAFIGTAVTALILVLSIPGLIVGFGLLRFRPWARVAGIVISGLDLLHIPFGTVIGIYGLWVLLQPQTEALFAQPPYPGYQPAPYSPPAPPRAGGPTV